MPERTSYAPGTPSWVDIGTDVEGAKTFYGGLFGWQAQDAGPPDETGGYGFFTRADGKHLAGYGPQQSPGPPFWTTYVTVADVEATVAKVEPAGGQVIMAPMDVMTAGRMAVIQDPEGAFISLWQAGDQIGAEVVNDPGSYSWSELNTRDPEGAKAFYGEVFGWGARTSEGEMPYTEWQVDGQSVGGMLEMPPGMPAEVPPHWLVYFAVDDVEATVAKAQELGADLRFGPEDTPAGPIAVLGDPQGAGFAVIAVLSHPAES